MATDDFSTGRFTTLTAILTLAALGLFLGLGLFLYDVVKPTSGTSEDPREKRREVDARNLAVIDGKEPGTRPMADAMKEFAVKQTEGKPPFPVPPAKKP